MENQDNDKIDKTPLLKPKKTRPPPSEKQMENFKKMAEKRAENIKKKKEDKILAAKRELLEKEGYVKSTIPLIEKESIQFNITDDENNDEKIIAQTPQLSKPKKILKSKLLESLPLDKTENKKQIIKKSKQKIIESSSSSDLEDSDCNSSSSEEIVIIKRTKKQKSTKELKANKPMKQKQINPILDYEEEEYVAPQIPNYINYFL